jgi:hypothetical protein
VSLSVALAGEDVDDGIEECVDAHITKERGELLGAFVAIATNDPLTPLIGLLISAGLVAMGRFIMNAGAPHAYLSKGLAKFLSMAVGRMASHWTHSGHQWSS